jgi:ABC-type transport system involved in cytochrome bd biosynthesis fused ATPase/permease subunit
MSGLDYDAGHLLFQQTVKSALSQARKQMTTFLKQHPDLCRTGVQGYLLPVETAADRTSVRQSLQQMQTSGNLDGYESAVQTIIAHKGRQGLESLINSGRPPQIGG